MKNFHLIKLISISSYFLLFPPILKAQTSIYTVSGPIKGQGPLLNTEPISIGVGWNMIHPSTAYGGSSVNSWSSAQSIGFPFSFYGSPATHFCVSKNYLLTFDTTVAGTTVNSSITTDNTALPNANLPDSTIAYFWGGFNPPLGYNDDVWRKTFSTIPNRQLWIKNYSYKHEAQGYSYNFVVLEETTHKIYVVNGWWNRQGVGSYTVGIQLNSTTAVQHSSSPNISSINTSGGSNPWPNVDYYEFTPRFLVNDDAGILSLDAPASKTAPGSQSVQVSIKNHGINNLDSVRVNWSVDGVNQTFHSWTGSLAPGAVAAAVNIGSYNFTLGNPTLKIWTSNPNGNPDNNTSNDTLEVSLFVCNLLSGAYTLGGTSSDFPNFDSLATLLNKFNKCGVSGPVIIKVAPGTYREQLTLGNIAGVSPINTIVIDGGNSSLARLTHDGLTSNATVSFDSTSYVSLKNITLENTKSSANAWVVHLQNTDHIVIDSCLIEQPVNATFDRAGIVGLGSLNSTLTATTNKHLTVSDNIITGGYYGIALSSNTSDKDVGNHILRNRFSDIETIAIGVREQDSLIISGNVIENTNSSLAYDIYCLDITGFEIRANNLLDCGGQGIVIDGRSSSGIVPSLIANNMIYAPDAAIRIAKYSSNVNIYHNTAVGNPAMEFTSSNNSDISLYNNIFSSPSGVALKASSNLSPIIDIDYNLYQASGNIAEDGSTSYASLAAWQAAKPALNQNSVEGNPLFVRATSPADLHLTGTLANDTGDNSVGIKVDIDGDSRPLPPSTRVDIGADEYHPPACLPSSGLSASIRSASAAILSWTTGGALNWNIEYGLSGFTLGSGTRISTTTPSYAVNGLAPGTDYDFYVRDSCGVGHVSSWAGPHTFTTLSATLPCPSPSSLLATQITQTNATLSWVAGGASNWDLEYGLSGFTLGSGTRISTTIPSYTVSGLTLGRSYQFYVRDSCGVGHVSSWAGPHTFTTLSATLPCPAPSSLLATHITQNSARLSWVTGGASNWDVEYGLSGFTLGRGTRISTTTPFYTVSGLTPGQSYQFYVRDSCGVGHVSSWAGPDAFTTFWITLPCPVPSSLLASNITQTSATLSWIMGGTSNWDVEYGLSGFTLGRGTRISTTTPSYAVSGLTPGQFYQFYVRDSCGVGHVSSWAGPYTFTTLSATLPCPVPSSLLATQITQTNARLSWITGGISISNNWDVEYGLSGFTLGSGTRISTTISFYTVSGLTSGTDYQFYVRDSCGVGHVSSWAGPHTFITLSATLPCPSPSSLSATQITQNSARLSWVTGGASNWDLEYGLSGFTLGSGTRISTTTPSYTVSGLTPGRSYQFYVRDSCGVGHVSSWAGPHTFRTLGCLAPTGLNLHTITEITATVSWTSGGASNWNIEYGPINFPLGGGIFLYNVSSPRTLRGLKPNTFYDVYVQDSCNVGNVSNWVGPLSIKTIIGIDELLERSFRIYPNPSEEVFKLEFSSSLGEDMEIRITNMMGQIVLEDEIESFSGSYRKRLEMGAYRSGVYLLQLITEKATVNRRIILQ